ncbi:FAD-dependent oxidoreductase [Faecalicatena acetigenes]|uniref:FAD-dependent oxidoreductase n=1 Tax=Faecalicatena acetigenes TaxID=2981790 RepID=A0ABT2TEV3_9FIRM|nr:MULTISPECIES: FAD-dependent oxidoreductase [Lachnospiraceae]MCU6748810.1 FAD-dependent oxidoreductase [Faecalicatena acetigenes]SCI66869.1 NADH oxidase [uncultured Clostridium sp.]
MATKYEHLFSPVKVGGIEIPNRIAMMPMGVFSPRLMNPKTGAYTKDGADYYIERAKGGTGLIITGLAPIIPMPFMNPVNHPEEYIEQMKYLTEGIHKYGSKIFIQLTAMTGRAAHLENEISWKMLPAPAPIQNVWDPTIKNRGITKDEIHLYVKNFAQAAYEVQQAGGDGVEIHAVHEGYLLDQFAIGFYNKRDDEYGGSLENRLRFPKEIVEAIKEKCGKDFPVSLRFSVRSYVKDFNRGALPGEEYEEKGRNLEEAIEAVKLLESYGYDMLNCDNGSYDSWFWAHPPVYMPKACNLADVEKVKEAVSIPVVCAGRFDNPELADKEIAEGKIDIMGMGRPLLADPELGKKFYEGRLDDIRPCISCHQGCLGRIFQDKDISCAVNPACGREKSYKLQPAEQKKKVLVIGGGLGGMEAARVCAIRGHEVDLYEKNSELGGVFIAAAAPEFKEDDKNLLKWYRKQMCDLGVNVHLNTEVTEEMTSGYDEIFVATGAKERKLAIPGFDAENVTYAVDTLQQVKIDGENVLVVGGGLTGCEIAYMLGKEGKKVTIVEMTETILNAFGLSAANYNMLMELLDYYKVKVIKNAVVESYKAGIATVVETEKNYPNTANRAKRMFALGVQGMKVKHEIPADHIVVSVGYIPENTLYEKIKGDHVYLIGDAEQPTNVMDAVWSAYETAMKL